MCQVLVSSVCTAASTVQINNRLVVERAFLYD